MVNSFRSGLISLWEGDLMRKSTIASLTLAAVFAAGAAQAGTVTLSLGTSNEDYVLFGQGPVAPGVGSFTNQQGAESYDSGSNTTTDTLTGAIAGSNVAGFSSGSYTFTTTYTGTPIGLGGSEIQAQTDPSNLNFFFYSFFDPSVDMTLTLTGTPDGNLTIPLVTNGAFDPGSFSFAYTNGTCAGVAVCTQNDVGLTPGASISAPVTISVSFAAVPEPATWAIMLMGFGGLGMALRSRRRAASTTA
jgi:hypothetical protein